MFDRSLISLLLGAFFWLGGAVWWFTRAAQWSEVRRQAARQKHAESEFVFPPSFRWLWNLQIFSYIAVGILGGGLGIPYLLMVLQRWFFGWTGAQIYIHGENYLNYFFPCFFTGIVLWAAILLSVCGLYPAYGKYQALADKFAKQGAASQPRERQLELKQHLWRNENWPAYIAGERASVYQILGVFHLVFMPFVVLAFNTYAVFSPGELRINRYWELHERTYRWDQVQSAKLCAVRSNTGKNKDSLDVYFKMRLSDGSAYDLDGNQSVALLLPVEGIISTARRLRQNNVRVIVQPLSAEDQACIARKFGSVQQDYHRIWNEVSALPGVEIAPP